MTEFYVNIGDSAQFTKTVSESDVYQFAGITGDFSPNHINKVYMENSSFGRLMAHGALLVGFMSTVSTIAIAHCREADETPVAVGYDKIRFLKPVFLGDTVTTTYTFSSIDPEKRKSKAKIEVKNQNDQLVAVAEHILQWVPNT
tara:strand:- start:177 stop:608 length:432 start_codon:yes stop_codon:yes gene_type:complete